jgi:hypothetical protein
MAGRMTDNEWVEDGGRRYCVNLDAARTVHAAWVQVAPHDKAPTMRRLKHPVTLARLQALVRQPKKCQHCGSVVSG